MASCAGIFSIALLAVGQPGKYEAGLRSFERRDFSAAEQEFSKLLSGNPADSHAHKLLGMTLAAQEKYSEATSHFAAACETPVEKDACYYLGRALFATARFEAARAAFEKELTRKNEANRGKSMDGLGLVYEALSKPALAEQNYREAIAAGEKQALVDFGMFLAKQGRYSEGLSLLDKAGAHREADVIRREIAGHTLKQPEAAATDIRFDAAELAMTLRNGAEGNKHLIETMAGGVGAIDFDRDGWPDIFVANGASSPGLIKTSDSFSNRLFRNQHDGTFADVTASAGLAGDGFSVGVAVADFDNDGYPDLFVTGVNGNHLYRNRGDGSFEDITERAGVRGNGKWSTGAGWFDYDNDGLLDLFVVNYVDWRPELDVFCGFAGDTASGRASYRQYCHPKQYPPVSNLLYRNLGNGRFQDVSAGSGIAPFAGKGMSVTFGDYDGDGRLDIFVTNDTVPNYLFHNEGKGHFREVAVEAGVAYAGDGKALSSMGADFRDYDNDGREDIFVTALSDETFPLFRNAGDGHFLELTMSSGLSRATPPYTGWSTGFFDFNNDGLKDLFVAAGHVMDNAEASSGRSSKQPALLLAGQGSGRFNLKTLPGAALHRGAAFADFNRDGRVDVALTRLNEPPVVLWNHSSGSGHWLDVQLLGRRSNHDGLGAMIHLKTASGEQWNRAATAVGYASSSDSVVHFGLGPDTSVLRMEISWPSGTKSVSTPAGVDRMITVGEP